jgi:hypothetical protein
MNSLKVDLNLSKAQLAKLRAGHKKKLSDIPIKFSNQQLKPGPHTVTVNWKQAKKMESASRRGKGVVIHFTSQQVGGFLPFLAPFMPAIIAGLSAAGTGAAGAAGALAVKKIAGEGLFIPGGRGLKKKRVLRRR